MIDDWKVIASMPNGTTTYTDNSALTNENYKYAVAHKDLAYNYSHALMSDNISSGIANKKRTTFSCIGVKGSIELAKLQTDVDIVVYNIYGAKVANIKSNTSNISISVLPGIYLVKVGNEVAKVMVK